jgi:hypothetical protein
MKSTSRSTVNAFILHPSSLIPFNFFQQRIHALRLLFNRVAHEMKHGSMPQVKREAKLLAYVRRCMSQRAQRDLVFVLVTGNGYVNTGVPQIVSDSDFSYRDHRQARVSQFVTNNLRNLFSQRFRDALRAMHNCKDEG